MFLYSGPTVPQSQAPGFNQAQDEMTCPALDILENKAAYRGGTPAQQASGVAFQASIAMWRRECAFQGGQLRIRVGVEGRVLLGQNGRPGTFSVPVRVVVKRRSDVVAQRFVRLSVTVPANDTQADFVHVEENVVVRSARSIRATSTTSTSASIRPRSRRRARRGSVAEGGRSPASGWEPIDKALSLDSRRGQTIPCGEFDGAPATSTPKAQPPRKRSGPRTAGRRPRRAPLSLWKAARREATLTDGEGGFASL